MKQIKVLLIEDDESARNQLGRVIEKEGFKVISAENGTSGMNIFKSESPEIVITDLVMPGMDGLEVMRRVKKIDAQSQVILITAYGESDTAISALREGALDYLKKPIDFDMLLLALGRAREKIFELEQSSPYPTILLVDDDDGARTRFERELVKEGWEVVSAANGSEALDIFKERKIDIIITDIKMPKMNGLELLHEVRQISDDCEAIILTGYGDESSAIKAMRDGAMNFLKKPVDLDQLIISVEKAVEKLNIGRALRFRTRELELAQTIIAQITSGREIIINLHGIGDGPVYQYATRLLDTLPLGLMAVRKGWDIAYVNKHLYGILGSEAKALDDTVVEKLRSQHGCDIKTDMLRSMVGEMFNVPVGAIQEKEIGEGSRVTLVQVLVRLEDRMEKVVLLVFQCG